jgi:putative glycosyltransferase (TIGR04348 family)
VSKPRVLIVSPASAQDNNGNWRTASRWAAFLAGVAEVEIARTWGGAPCDALIALHARRSADAIARMRAQRPATPIGVVLTGTDVYRDIAGNEAAQHSLECASQLAVLQPDALTQLAPAHRAKARVIVQSATAWRRRPTSSGPVTFVAVGHLREEKDPRTLMAAARSVRTDARIRIVHVGEALEPALAEAARATMADCPHYRWIGGVSRGAARAWIARSRALVHMSRMEGGAQAIIEAVRTGVPVLASRIGGNVGLLGEDYAGYFDAGDARSLASAMERLASDAGFASLLEAQCARREPGFRPALERRLVREWLTALIGPAPDVESARSD